MKNSLIALLLFCSLTSVGQPFGKLLPNTPGVVSYTFRERFAKDVPGTLDLIEGMGITNIEFSNLFGKTATELRALLDQRGMRCTSFGVGYTDLTNKMDTVVSNAKILGAKYVRLGYYPHKGEATYALILEAANAFNTFGKQLKTAGLQFCYHNHGFEFVPVRDSMYQDGTLFDVLMKKTDPAYVGFEMDVVWTQLPGQDPVQLMNRYPNRYKLMHLKDLKKGVPTSLSGSTSAENSVILGKGQINYPALLRAARRSSVEFFYVEDESTIPDQQVPESLTYLKGL